MARTHIGTSLITPLDANLAAGSNKITGLANGTASGDAATFGQIFYGFQAAVQGTTITASTTSSSTYAATALSANMTMTNAAHRVRITVSGGAARNGNPAATNHCMTIFRDSTNLGQAIGFQVTSAGALATSIDMPVAMSWIDTPGDTSAHTYAVYHKSSNNSTACTFNVQTTTASIILEEIV